MSQFGEFVGQFGPEVFVNGKMHVNIKVKKQFSDAKLPTRATEFAAGWDLYAYIPLGRHSLLPGSRLVIDAGICLEIPEGYEGQIRPRSGMARKEGVLAAFGTIDSDYRGLIGVNLFNHSFATATIEHGQRIAQLVISPVLKVSFEEALELSETIRGANGFGSSGK
jgi:dUTP pyrophosphatase